MSAERIPKLARVNAPTDPGFLETQCSNVRDSLERAALYAAYEDIKILIEGESGTGKTFVAQFIHTRSPRAWQPFVRVLLSSTCETRAYSDLFGHVRGAYTGADGDRKGAFATANGGTLCLDEVSKASLRIQEMLLQAIEERQFNPMGCDRIVEVDVRLIFMTNESLESRVSAGTFRRDTFARMRSFKIELVPLRERRADIPALVEHFVKRYALLRGYLKPPTVHPDLMAALQSASWPDNIRQLDGCINRIVTDACGCEVLSTDLCPADFADLRDAIRRQQDPVTTDRVKAAIEAAGTKSGAARKLGIARTTLDRHLRREPPPTQV